MMMRIKIFIPFISLLFFSIAILNTSCKTQAVAQKVVNVDPYMTFEEQHKDFGTVKAGERPEFVYRFTNTGKEPITVEMISGCDCTEFVDVLDNKTYQPGEGGQFKIIFKSETEEERGPINKTIDILLTNTDKKTGYQIIKEVSYNLILED